MTAIAPQRPAPEPEETAQGLETDTGSGRGDGWRRLARHLGPSDWVAAAFLLLVILAVLFPGWLSPFDPLDDEAGPVLVGPSLHNWLGTDYLGRDLLSRLIHGAATTLTASFVAVVVGLVGGVVLGVVSGYLGGWVDAGVSRVIDVLLSVPGLLLSMVIVVSLGFGSINAAIAVGISSIASFSRLTRSEVLRVRTSPFVEAAQHQGSSRLRTLGTHILPNSIGAVIALIPLQLGGAIVWISTLSFLGFGAVPPDPEWGLLVNEGLQYLLPAPWLLIVPGVTIVITVVAFAHLQRSLTRIRKAIDL